MSFNITVEGGTSIRLPTAGKYCDRDIIVTAEGGGIELDVITASTLPDAVTDGQIVVITDTTPGTVYIDTDEPASPATGDVWVKLEAEATVKLELSEESPYLRGGLTAAAQWDGSEWVSCDGYLGVDGAWEKISLSIPAIGTPLNDFTWEQIAAVAASGRAQDYFAAGDAKEIVINGTVGNMPFVRQSAWAYIIGFDHNPTYEGNNTIHFQIGKSAQADGIDLCLVDLLYGETPTEEGYFTMNLTRANKNGWASSYMRNVLLGNDGTPSAPLTGSLMAALPADLRNVIKAATKYSDNKGSNSQDASNVTATTDYLWLLGACEVFGESGALSGGGYANDAELTYQMQYAYFAAGNSAKKYKHNDQASLATWWLRSVRSDGSATWAVGGTSGKIGSSYANQSYGLAPCFCV